MTGDPIGWHRTERHAPCRCGHPRSSHEHYRAGDDCGTCGRVGCRAYRRPGRLGPYLQVLRFRARLWWSDWQASR